MRWRGWTNLFAQFKDGHGQMFWVGITCSIGLMADFHAVHLPAFASLSRGGIDRRLPRPFNGVALVVRQPTGIPDTMTLSASSSTLASAQKEGG